MIQPRQKSNGCRIIDDADQSEILKPMNTEGVLELFVLSVIFWVIFAVLFFLI